MANHDGISEIIAWYETASHIDGAKHGLTPAIANYGDLTSGLVEDLKKALKDLEALAYVLFGARPARYIPDYKPPWHDNHPRRLWPEQLNQVFCPATEFDPVSWAPDSKEYLARGQVRFDFPVPSVPLKSRSGDWRLQVLDKTKIRDLRYFPYFDEDGEFTVSRDDGTVFDIEGRGWFDGDPTTLGYDASVSDYAWEVHYPGRDATITYHPPMRKREALRLGEAWVCYQVLLDGDIVDSSEILMEEDGGYWTADIPAQAHGSLVQWYVRASFDEGDSEPVTRYEPGGEIPPMGDSGEVWEGAYTFCCFTHHNPYASGFPEMDPTIRKGTDWYEFDRNEPIQPAMLNMARALCDAIGSYISHSPITRGGAPYSCMECPIIFAWSGSATELKYLRGGKSSAVYPLHNLTDMEESGAQGDEAARRSWRGVGNWVIGNNQYGKGGSWETVPPIVRVDLAAQADDPDNQYIPIEAGLQSGDVIDTIHIEEIVAAANFLKSNGLWIKAPVRFRVYSKEGCGYDTDGGPYGLCECKYGAGGSAVPFAGPDDWEDCWATDSNPPVPYNKAPFGKCTYSRSSTLEEDIAGGIGTTYSRWGFICNHGDLNSPCPSWNGRCDGLAGGGYIHGEQFHIDGPDGYKRCDAESCGMTAWVCTPARNLYGVDEYHGNGWVKSRVEGTCGDWENVAYARSAGNRFDIDFGAWTDGTIIVGDPSKPHHMNLESVHAIDIPGGDQGGASAWLESDCGLDIGSGSFVGSCLNDGSFPDLPPYEGHLYPEEWDEWLSYVGLGQYQCEFPTCEDGEFGVNTTGGCQAAIPSCAEEKAWVRVDLNLDEEGTPRLFDYVPDPGSAYYLPPFEGTLESMETRDRGPGEDVE